jgi:hypothetical protein
MKKLLWSLLIPTSFWSCAIFHKVFELSLYPEKWYSMSLLLTYICIISTCTIPAIIKLID